MIKDSKNKVGSKKILGWGFLILAIIIGAVLLFFSSAKFASSKDNQTKAKEIEISSFNPSPSAEGDLVTKVDGLKANYFKNRNFEWQSEIIKTDFAFDALGASWNKNETSAINIFVRFSKDNKDWESWQEMVVDDADQGNEKSASAQNSSLEISDLVFSKDALYFQYKVVFEDKKQESILESIKFTYIKSAEANKSFSLLNYLGIKEAEAVNSPRIISRAEWGANPGYMTWPPEYVRPNKIIIHHTASGNNPPDPAAVVRSIYYYHAVSLGWGDIGYNYLFDQYGNIYEGRAGGNGAVGAHAYGQNYGSIGFSAIGDFSGADITSSTLGSLIDMTAYKAYENDFDLTLNTVFGHRDFCNNPAGHNCTACPGNVLYSRKGQIIDVARQNIGAYLQRDRDFLNQNNNVLVKSYSHPEVYLWQDGVKRHITDQKTFALFGYSWNSINYVSIIALNEKPEGPKLSAIVKVQDDPRVYLVKNNPQARYWVTDPALFADFGLDWNSVIPINQNELDAISYLGPLKPVIRGINSTPVYHLSLGKKEYFADMLALEGWGYSASDIVDLPSSFVDTYPQDPTLYNLARGDGVNVFLLQNGQRYKVPNPDVFSSFGFKGNEITDINLSRLAALAEGPNLSRIVKGSGPTVYLIDNNKKHSFPDPQTLGLWGKTPDQAFSADDRLLTRIPDGCVVTDLARSAERPEVYLMYGGKKYHLSDPQTFVGWNKNWPDIRNYSLALINELSPGESALTNFIKKSVTPEEPEIYLVAAGAKRHLPNPAIFYLWGGDENKISRIPLGLFDSLSLGSEVSVAVRGSGPEIYLLDKGKKDHIMSPDVFTAWGLTNNQVTVTSDQYLTNLPNGPEIGFLIRAEGLPKVYKVEYGQKAWVPDPNIFNAWGFSFNNVAVIDPLLAEILPDDSALTLFAKTSADSPIVYLLNQTDKKQFSDSAILEAWSNNASPSISQLINNLPTNGNPTKLAKGPGQEIYLILSGKKYHLVNWAAFIAFSYSLDQVTIVSAGTINSVAYGGELNRLVRGSGPEIYLVENGQKRHIPSPEIFSSYGWSWSDITGMPDSFIAQLPVGPDVPFNLPSVPALNITANGPYTAINSSGQTIGSANGNDHLWTTYYNGTYYLFNANNAILWSGGASIKFVPSSGDVIMEISSYSDPNWNGSANYNRFRGTIEVIHSGSGTWAVNELSLNDYTAGICEAPGGHPEYLKTMAVAARSYGLWHLSRGGKHAGEPFILKNSRQGNGNDQVYCGYGFEAIASSYAPQARATDNQVVLYNWNPILAAYSHGSYPRTRSALEVWGTDYPYLQSVADPYGDPARPCGTGGNHCVGLSASGAIGFAGHGSSYIDILRYYYQGTGVAAVPSQNIRIAIYAF